MARSSLAEDHFVPLQDPPCILYRTQRTDRHPSAHSFNTFENGNIVARCRNRRLSRTAFDACLSWTRANTPLIPFTNSWERALRRRQRLLQAGINNVAIVAVFAKGMPNVYDAYDVALELGYRDDHADPNRRPGAHVDEYLVHGGIAVHEYRLLAIFEGHGDPVNVRMTLPGLEVSIRIPPEFLRHGVERTAKEKLEKEIYIRTGIRGSSEQLLYLMGSMMNAFGNPFISFTVQADVPRSAIT